MDERYVGGGREAVERAHDRADRVGGHPRIEAGGLELGMAEQDLNHPDIDLLLQEVGRNS
jgi:hypothetical protein